MKLLNDIMVLQKKETQQLGEALLRFTSLYSSHLKRRSQPMRKTAKDTDHSQAQAIKP